jgi:hypothetical protein
MALTVGPQKNTNAPLSRVGGKSTGLAAYQHENNGWLGGVWGLETTLKPYSRWYISHHLVLLAPVCTSLPGQTITGQVGYARGGPASFIPQPSPACAMGLELTRDYASGVARRKWLLNHSAAAGPFPRAEVSAGGSRAEPR